VRRPVAAAYSLGPVLVGLSAAGVLVAGWFLVVIGPQGMGYDLMAYWDVRLDDVYGRSAGTLWAIGAFRYSPVMAFVMAPLHVLPFQVVLVLWTTLLVGALWWMCGKWTLAVLAFPGVDTSIYVGNIDILIAAAIVVALRYPAAWSFGLLTKVTPGIGLIWHAARREWRQLAIAIGVTALLVFPTVIVRPELWTAWFAMLRDNSTLPTGNEVPLVYRVPIAAVLVWAGARTNRPWVLGIAIAFCEPVLGLRSWAVAVASVALLVRAPLGRGVPPVAVQQPEAVEVLEEARGDRLERPGRDRVLADPSAVEPGR